MKNKRLGKIIILVAPSGAGKSTLLKKIKDDFPMIIESISSTTRSPRIGEVDGKHYFFISKDEFLKRRDEGEFLEWAEVHSNYYGTSKKFVESQILEGISMIFDIDVQGTDAFKDHFNEKARAIFISPPSLDVLEQRLGKRGTDRCDVIRERIENAKGELLRKDDYDYLLVNDDLEETYLKLKMIVDNILRN